MPNALRWLPFKSQKYQNDFLLGPAEDPAVIIVIVIIIIISGSSSSSSSSSSGNRSSSNNIYFYSIAVVIIVSAGFELWVDECYSPGSFQISKSLFSIVSQ